MTGVGGNYVRKLLDRWIMLRKIPIHKERACCYYATDDYVMKNCLGVLSDLLSSVVCGELAGYESVYGSPPVF